MDDLLALLVDDSTHGTTTDTEDQERTDSPEPSNPQPRRTDQPRPTPCPPPASPPAASADTKVGVRMLHRRISGADLLDLIDSYPYHSAPSIAAMSTAALNRLLIDPASTVLDRASTVCGPTNLITVAVVLHNSGTKLSSHSGNAYCILTLGTLTSGPAVSVMLFGAAYSEHCRNCQPGRVVALVCPRLAPHKPHKGPQAANYATTVLFSVQTTDQCQVVADARDFGRCKAKIGTVYQRGSAEASQGSDPAGPMSKYCRAIIDTRQGEYCPLHRKLASHKSKGAPSGKHGNAWDAVVAESRAFPTATTQTRTLQTASGRTLTMPLKQRAPGPEKQRGLQQLHRPTPSTLIGPPSHIPRPLGDKVITTGALLPSMARPLPTRAATRTGSGVERQVLRASGVSNRENRLGGLALTDAKLVPSSIPVTTNPYGGVRSREPPLRMTKKLTSSEANDSVPVTTDWLHPQGRRVSLSSEKKPIPKRLGDASTAKGKRINLDTVPRDGSVLVPRPSTSVAAMSLKPGPMGGRPSLPQPKERSPDEIILKQQAVAEKLRMPTSTASQPLRKSPAQLKETQSTLISHREALLFPDVLAYVEMEVVLAAKSKFESEAMAEEYTRSRNRLEALDQQEVKKQKSGMMQEGPIEKTWHCATCKQTFKKPPLLCQRRGHSVKLQRSIQEEKKTRDEERRNLSETKDGLILGTGLEWSRWPK